MGILISFIMYIKLMKMRIGKYCKYAFFAMLVIVLPAGLLFFHFGCRKITIERYNSVGRSARIYPDYCGIVCPANITPLNFVVKEDGSSYFVKIYSDKGEPIEVHGKKAKVIIPEKSWHRLLEANRGGRLYFEIFVKTADGQWNCFDRIENKIADEDIDNFAVYRKMHPTHVLFYGNTGIYQRDLRSYDEKLILDKSYLGDGGCLNCHSFCGNSPDKMVTGIRSTDYGISTLFIQDGMASKINTKFGYSSWHPSGKLVIYSVDDLPMFFHSARSEVRDTVDVDSYLAYYLVDPKVAKTVPALARKERLETWPVWSADGKYLYFCSAPMLWAKTKQIPPDEYKNVRYNLVRISYDVAGDKWGQEETLISSADSGQSIGMPRTSPDGRWLSCCMFDYGFFPTWQKSSDLYLVDLEEGKLGGRSVPKKLTINSEESESWHCWSSNSRWIIFSSKRDHGVFTRLYISYIDKDGNAYKPLVLPQKNPLFYDSCLLTYNTPELITRPVPARCEELARVIRTTEKKQISMPITSATPKVEGTADSNQYRQRE
jgi:Tol biopolymer transport system component